MTSTRKTSSLSTLLLSAWVVCLIIACIISFSGTDILVIYWLTAGACFCLLENRASGRPYSKLMLGLLVFWLLTAIGVLPYPLF